MHIFAPNGGYCLCNIWILFNYDLRLVACIKICYFEIQIQKILLFSPLNNIQQFLIKLGVKKVFPRSKNCRKKESCKEGHTEKIEQVFDTIQVLPLMLKKFLDKLLPNKKKKKTGTT